MGCGATKVYTNNTVDTPIRRQEKRCDTRVSSTNGFGLEISGPGTSTIKEITTIKDFKVNASDFITEKKGKIQNDYTLLNPVLGKGSYGEVRRAVHKLTNITRAVKIIFKNSTNKNEQEALINEVMILKNLDHPNIMKIIEFFQDDKCLYIVSEYYTGGELFERILKTKAFTEHNAANTIKQILSAVNYCHHHNIVHRDLKPENILYETKNEDSLIKVIDFGTSKVFDPKSKMSQKFGTPYYIAPEVIRRKYNEKCDIWSCGVILFILLCGHPPFNGNNDKAIMDKVLLGKYDFNHANWEKVSDEAKKFITKLLEKDVGLRLTAEQALNDEWIKKYTGINEIDKPLAMNALTNLRNFRAERKLQEATWIYLVTYIATKDEKNHLLKIFQALDTNGDGQLSREELMQGYKQIMNNDIPEQEVDNIMRVVDVNNSGAIDYTEFVMATINKQSLLSKERLNAAFKMFDKGAKAKSGDEKVESSDERVESSDERVENSDERVENSDERVESDDERVESSDERVESSDERVESSDERVESDDEREW